MEDGSGNEEEAVANARNDVSLPVNSRGRVDTAEKDAREARAEKKRERKTEAG